MTKFRRNIAKFEGTVGNVLTACRDEIMSAKSPIEVYDKVKASFEKANVTSPMSKKMLFKLQNSHSLVNSLTYVQNTIFASSGMATY